MVKHVQPVLSLSAEHCQSRIDFHGMCVQQNPEQLRADFDSPRIVLYSSVSCKGPLCLRGDCLCPHVPSRTQPPRPKCFEVFVVGGFFDSLPTKSNNVHTLSSSKCTSDFTTVRKASQHRGTKLSTLHPEA